MKIKKGDHIRITDKEAIYLGDDLTNGEEYQVICTFGDGGFAIVDDEGDILPIEPKEAARAVEVVEDYEEKEEVIAKLFAELLFSLIQEERKESENMEIKLDNLARKQIIEDAKKFVEEHTKPNCKVKNTPAVAYRRIFGVIPEFHVNKEKRVVTVLLRGAGDGEILRKEIARCAEGDVFNEHIGKAIALGRALDLNVRKFINAPQPGDAAVGQKFVSAAKIEGKVTELVPALDGIFGTAFRHTYAFGWLGFEQVEITDDTEATYE